MLNAGVVCEDNCLLDTMPFKPGEKRCRLRDIRIDPEVGDEVLGDNSMLYRVDLESHENLENASKRF